MLLNRKCVYLGVTLFSAMILGTLSQQQTIKAATTSDSTASAVIPSSSNQTTSQTSGTTAPATTTGTTSTATAPVATTSETATSTVAPTATTSETATSTMAPTATTNGTTTAPTSGTATSTVAPATTTSGTTTSTAPATASTTTTSKTSTASVTVSNQPATTATTPSSTTGQTTGTTTTGATTTTTAPTSYAIPSDVTDSTVVNFTDPTLENTVKSWMNIPATSNLTVGDIKSYTGNDVDVSVTSYDMKSMKPGSYLADVNSTPIESLNGMQYLQLLPAKATVTLQANMASDSGADDDLTPLDNLKLSGLTLNGNFSDPSFKEIDVKQLANLNLSQASTVALNGDTSSDGINQTDLNEIAPVLNKYANNGQGFNMIEMDNSSISDFSPLKGTETGKSVMIDAVGNTINDPTTVYGVDNQPVTFTAPKLLDPNGVDIAKDYTFAYSVPKTDLKDDNLTSSGNDVYVLKTPDSTDSTLSYGNYGFDYGYASDSVVRENLGNTYFEVSTTVNQPIVWQAHPTVTIDYVDSTGKPIMAKGVAMSKVLDGTNIGDPYDLTADSKLAGYTLKSPITTLKGNYTQDPQVIDLVYSQIPVQETSTTPVQPVSVMPKSSEPVKIYDVTGNSTASEYLSDIGVRGTATINGKLFYQVGYGQLVEADDYDAVTSTTPGVVRTFGTKEDLVDANGDPITVELSPDTAWKFDKIVSINGKGYYQVATDEFLPVSSGVDFTPTTSLATVDLGSRTTVYNSEGQAVSTLSAGSSWASDGSAIINGVKMYRVATDEWIPAGNTKAYEPAKTDYRTTAITPLYDQNGEVLSATLPADTNWKVDQIIYINGQAYYRVATNEYIKA